MSLQIIILAAGQGKRMYSNTPKVLHKLAGKAMLQRVIETAQQLNPDNIHIVYGYGGQQIHDALSHLAVNWVLQAEQLGTGHAVMQALQYIPANSQIVVLSADVPLIQAQTLHALIDSNKLQSVGASALSLLLASMDNPTGLGRIIRNPWGEIRAIVEEKDATIEQKRIKEIYTGICCAHASDFARWLPQLNNNNAQGEYYLTEIISMAVAEQLTITSIQATDVIEVQGVNNRQQLQQLERVWQERNAKQLMLNGLSIADASRLDIRGKLEYGYDVFIDINVLLMGDNVIGDHCYIGPNCVLTNVTLGANCKIFPNSVLENCTVGDNCEIGPFARLRPQTQLAANCKIGNFVETKNVRFAEGTKASHLSYLGDAILGKNVNIGAGTITCNYDGVNKHQTIIEDGAFIGSDTQLVAPVTVGAYATIGAGSTIRRNAPADELTLTESKQKTIFGWKRPTKRSNEPL